MKPKFIIKHHNESTGLWDFRVTQKNASELTLRHRYGQIPGVAVNRNLYEGFNDDGGFVADKDATPRYRFLNENRLYTVTGGSFFLEAKDLKTGHTVLIKVPRPGKSSEEIRRFVLEATLVANLNRESMVPRGIPKRVDLVGVPIKYKGQEMLMPGIVSTMAECNWDMFRESLPSQYNLNVEAAKMLVDIGHALEYMHNFSGDTALIHADVKGMNILRVAEGGYQLTDYGSVQGKYRAGLPDDLTAAGGFTRGYSLFEPNESRDDIDWSEDLFALATVVEESLKREDLIELCKIAKDPNQTQFTNIMDFVNAVVDQIEKELTSVQIDFIENYRQDIYSPASSFNY